MPADGEKLDEIIERVTVDAYGDEGYSSFAQAFEDEIDFPLDATLIGLSVEIRSVAFDGDERRCLLAVITHNGRDPPSFAPRPRSPSGSRSDAHQRVPAMAWHQLRHLAHQLRRSNSPPQSPPEQAGPRVRLGCGASNDSGKA